LAELFHRQEDCSQRQSTLQKQTLISTGQRSNIKIAAALAECRGSFCKGERS